MHGKPSGKFKFVMGEPTYKNQFYSDLVLPIQSVEGHQCVGNGKYSVVSNCQIFLYLIIFFILVSMERWWWFLHR